MNKTVVLAAAVSASVLMLTACSNVTHGTITSKVYDPPQTSVYFQPVYSQKCTTRYYTVRTSSGSRQASSRSCSSYVSGHVPVMEHSDACYRLNLKNSSGDTGSVCVPETAWNTARVGGQW